MPAGQPTRHPTPKRMSRLPHHPLEPHSLLSPPFSMTTSTSMTFPPRLSMTFSTPTSPTMKALVSTPFAWIALAHCLPATFYPMTTLIPISPTISRPPPLLAKTISTPLHHLLARSPIPNCSTKSSLTMPRCYPGVHPSTTMDPVVISTMVPKHPPLMMPLTFMSIGPSPLPILAALE